MAFLSMVANQNERRMSMIIAVANQKGGIGKTTTVLNLGAAAALDGKETCLVDLDPQGNLTKTFTKLQDGQPTIYHLLNYETPFQEIMVRTTIQDSFLIPAGKELAGFERSGANDPQLPYRLRKTLNHNAATFDLTLIDTPPTLGALTVNALTSADYLLIPIQPSFFCLQETNELMETYHLVKKNLNPKLEILGVLVTMYDPRTTMGKEAIGQIKEFFGDKVLSAPIPRNIKIEESPAAGESVITYAPKSPGAALYLEAYRELMNRA
jgi:chromosome partitioning protein